MVRQILMVCVASALVWGGARKAHAQEAIEKKVMQLEHDLADAELKGDPAVIERLEAANYTFTGPDGAITGKQDDVNDLKTGNFKAEAIDLGDLKVRVYGSTAVVNGKATLKNCKWRGKDISGDYQFTDVWAKVNGNWQLVAGQSATLAKQ
jgi:hypothetical protein